MLNGIAISHRHRLQTLPFHPGGGPEQPGTMSKGLWDLVILPTRTGPKGPFRPTRAAWCEPGRDRAGLLVPGDPKSDPRGRCMQKGALKKLNAEGYGAYGCPAPPFWGGQDGRG